MSIIESGTIPLTKGQYSHIVTVSEKVRQLKAALAEAEANQKMLVDVIVDSKPELVGKNIVLKTPFQPDAIHYDIVDELPKQGV